MSVYPTNGTQVKGVLISEGILALVLLPKKGAKLLIFLSRKICMKFKFSAQEIDLAPFVGNGIRVEIPSEIKSPLTCVSLSRLNHL